MTVLSYLLCCSVVIGSAGAIDRAGDAPRSRRAHQPAAAPGRRRPRCERRGERRPGARAGRLGGRAVRQVAQLGRPRRGGDRGQRGDLRGPPQLDRRMLVPSAAGTAAERGAGGQRLGIRTDLVPADQRRPATGRVLLGRPLLGRGQQRRRLRDALRRRLASRRGGAGSRSRRRSAAVPGRKASCGESPRPTAHRSCSTKNRWGL